ncbi:MAG: hypothetical protein KGS72_13310 [Cyanobacteria bacterium REEB67]|nr:hypothetical protein [Cyanobacteria bacterium REEB67]
MKNRRIASLTALASALTFGTISPAFCTDLATPFAPSVSANTSQAANPPKLEGPTEAKDAAELTLRATLQNNDYYTPIFFAPLSARPKSLEPVTSKFGSVKKVTSSATSLVNFVFDLRGFDWSKEGANAILEEKLKPHSEIAREFLRHKAEDERELAVVTSTLQLASVSGLDEAKTKKAIDNLAAQIGPDEAEKLHERLQTISTADGINSNTACALVGSSDQPGTTFTTPLSLVEDKASVDVEQKCMRLRSILEAASESDPVVATMTKRLHKYNHRSKFLQVTAKAVYATLGVAAFTPTLAAPIAETTLLTFMMVTGGPEQDKLLKEVYLSKCLQSRASLINEKAHLAVDCYDMAVHTKNPRLLACAKDLIRQMTSQKAMAAFMNVNTAPGADSTVENLAGISEPKAVDSPERATGGAASAKDKEASI